MRRGTVRKPLAYIMYLHTAAAVCGAVTFTRCSPPVRALTRAHIFIFLLRFFAIVFGVNCFFEIVFDVSCGARSAEDGEPS